MASFTYKVHLKGSPHCFVYPYLALLLLPSCVDLCMDVPWFVSLFFR